MMFRPGEHVTQKGNMQIAGTVLSVGKSVLFVHDYRSGCRAAKGKSWRIPLGQAAHMNSAQVEYYLASPRPGDPDPQEIIKRRLEIQATWTMEDRYQRKYNAPYAERHR